MTPISPMVEGSTANVSDDPFFYGWRYVERKRDDGTIFSEQVPLTEWDVLHPQEGDFIMTNDAHSEICRYLKGAFRYHLTNHPGALVLGDHRVDWQVEGIEPHGPDLSVFFDSAPWDPRRGTYPMHDMGARPICAIEVTSPSTRSGDFGEDNRILCGWHTSVRHHRSAGRERATRYPFPCLSSHAQRPRANPVAG